MRPLTMLLSLLLVVSGCGGQQEPPPRISEQVRGTGAGDDRTTDDAVADFDGTLEFEHTSGLVRGGYNHLVLSGDGTGQVTFGVDDPIAVTATGQQLAEIADALEDVDFGALSTEPSEDAVADDVDLYAFDYGGTAVEFDRGTMPEELQVLADLLTDLIADNEPTT